MEICLHSTIHLHGRQLSTTAYILLYIIVMVVVVVAVVIVEGVLRDHISEYESAKLY
jgi:hypothetical protein